MRFALVLLTVLPSLAHADVVVLKDGERVEGIVEERGAEVDVRLHFGTITFEKSEIERVEKSSTPLGAFEARRGALGARDIEGRYRLGLEAEKQGLDGFARDLYREVLDLSTDHRAARAALGYRRHDNTWMTEDEYMTGQGYVRHGGVWITREAALAAENAELERRRAEAELIARRADAARLDRLEADVAAARAEAAAARASAGDDAAIGYPVWVPYWTGTRWDHRRSAPAAGVQLSLSGSGGRIQLGVGASAPTVQRAPSLPRAAQPPVVARGAGR